MAFDGRAVALLPRDRESSSQQDPRACDEAHVALSMTTGELGVPAGATSKLIMNVLATFSEFERRIIRERRLEARAAKRQRGLPSAGLVPFAFVPAPANRQLKLVTAECDLVRQVFEKAAAGARPAETAAGLNRRGITTKKSGSVGGKPWTARAVLRVIENRVYLGERSSGPGEHVLADIWISESAVEVTPREGRDAQLPAKSGANTRRPRRGHRQGLFIC